MEKMGDWRERFIGALTARPSIRSASIAAGVSRQTAYRVRQHDIDFAAAWDAALHRSSVTAAARSQGRRNGAPGIDAPQAVCDAVGAIALLGWGTDTSGKTLYIVREGWRDLCKIGIATDAKARLCSIQANLPQPLAIIALFRSNRGRALEAFIHERFAVKRLRGEWFALDDADIHYIARIHRIFCEADGLAVDAWIGKASEE